MFYIILLKSKFVLKILILFRNRITKYRFVFIIWNQLFGILKNIKILNKFIIKCYTVNFTYIKKSYIPLTH